MQDLEQPSRSLALRDLEDTWRVRLEMAREQYQTASARYRKHLEEKPEGLIPRQGDPLALARRAESQALAEYIRILKIFTELTLHGRVLQRAVIASADGGQA